MDELKLVRWKDDFNKKVQHLQTEYDAFFQSKSITDCYHLEVNESSQTLDLQINTEQKVPQEIVNRLLKIFEETKPEDSI